jgi:hypothetical protein
MRYFLIFLLGLIPFLSPAQEVCIKPSTARWFLEQSDKVLILTKKDSLNTQQILNLSQIISYKDQIMLTYQSDSLTYIQKLATKDKELELSEKLIKQSEKKVKAQKVQKIAIVIGAILAILLIN